MGQSNMAAGATIGSNHNSRANDNEIQAGRGFWPGLCTSVKHSCRFASFTLLSKADYPAELNIPLPFSLLNNNSSKNQLEVMPAYWWMYNMYALARNTWKFQNRDKRVSKVQHIEFDALAPDTMEEIFHAIQLLELWTGKAYTLQNGKKETTEKQLIETGRKLLNGDEKTVNGLEILGENMENTHRKTVISKVYKAYHAYHDMLLYYAVNNLMTYVEQNKADIDSMNHNLKGNRKHNWVNLGGQIMLDEDLDKLRKDIGSGKLNSWKKIHKRYDDLWEKYQSDKQKHAFATLLELTGNSKLTPEIWKKELARAVEVQKYVRDQVYISRKKDYDNPYRQATFRNEEEMRAAIGTIDDNSFIIQVRKETEEYEKRVKRMVNKC
jgi:hypothetical protein